MTDKWKLAFDKLEKIDRKKPAGRSDYEGLLKIFLFAQARGLDADDVLVANMSNLRAIVPEGKKAKRENDLDRLVELFHWAATLTNKKLHLQLTGHRREIIHVKELPSPYRAFHERLYEVNLTDEQLEKIAKGSLQSYQFLVEGKDVLGDK